MLRLLLWGGLAPTWRCRRMASAISQGRAGFPCVELTLQTKSLRSRMGPQKFQISKLYTRGRSKRWIVGNTKTELSLKLNHSSSMLQVEHGHVSHPRKRIRQKITDGEGLGVLLAVPERDTASPCRPWNVHLFVCPPEPLKRQNKLNNMWPGDCVSDA